MLPAELTVLQVSPSDEGGGAEKVALGLHAEYLRRGYDAWLALGADHHLVANSLQIPNTAHRSAWARAVLSAAGLADPAEAPDLPRSLQRAARLLAEPARYRRVLSGLEDFDAPATNHLLELTPDPPDVLHLHNLHGSYFDIRVLPELTRRVPTLLTMHDAWLLTGHCAYPVECEKWRSGCGQCPALDRYVPLRRDRSATNRQVKRDAVRRSELRVATPSRWLSDLVASSDIAEAVRELRVIPNGIDTRLFSPGDGAAARRDLGLPADAFVLATTARNVTTSPFKGFGTLERALPAIAAGLEGRRLIVVAVGSEDAERTVAGATVRSVPFTKDAARLAAYYGAADVYVHPARAEAFGLSVLEAMACGTAVVASRVGGIPEIVLDARTGLLVEPDRPEALGEAVISLALDPSLRQTLSLASVERAASFTLERQTDSYLSWYEELTAEQERRAR